MLHLEYDSYCIQIRNGALQNGYNAYLYALGNYNTVLGDYGSIAKELYDGEKVSQRHYYSLLQPVKRLA